MPWITKDGKRILIGESKQSGRAIAPTDLRRGAATAKTNIIRTDESYAGGKRSELETAHYNKEVKGFNSLSAALSSGEKAALMEWG